jgi:hypothetical protein
MDQRSGISDHGVELNVEGSGIRVRIQSFGSSDHGSVIKASPLDPKT